MSATCLKVKPASRPAPGQYTTYTVPRRFLQGSKLHLYLAGKVPSMITMAKLDFTLFEVLSALRKVISSEKLFDPNNTTVIICSRDLETALNVKFMHITEVKDIVLLQMEVLSPVLLASLTPSTQTSVSAATSGGQQQAAPYFDMEGTYWVKPHFLKVLRMVKDVDQTKVKFSYREVVANLSKYILENKDRLFDSRNIKVAHVEGDPLGVAFNVKAFHRSQVTSLLRNQLIPCNSSVNGVTTANISKPSDADKIVTAQKLEIQSSHPRKRSPGSIKDELIIKSRRRLSSSNNSTLVVRTRDRESDDETIYSAQGYNTSSCHDVETSAHNSDASMVNEYDVYEIEYEPEGGSSDDDEPEKRSKKANPQSSGESDVDEIENVVIATAVKFMLNSDEVEATSDDEASSSEDEKVKDDFTKNDLENPDFWKCLDCKQPNTPYIRYCASCYKERKGWLPERPKPKKKRAASNKAKSSSKRAKSSSKEPEVEKASSQESGFGSLGLAGSSDDETCPGKASSLSRSLSLNTTGMLCTLCCAQPKNACLIHGRISHQVCCYGCAKKLFKNKRGCPVCRRKIEKITKNIVA